MSTACFTRQGPATARRSSHRFSYLCREIDLLTVKGKRQPVRIFEILQERKGASLKLEQIRKLFEGGLAAYRRQKWDLAEKAFGALKAEFKDEPSEVFLRRGRASLRPPTCRGCCPCRRRR